MYMYISPRTNMDMKQGSNHSGMDMNMNKTHGGNSGMGLNQGHIGMDMQMKMYFHTGEMVTLFFKDWMTMTSKEFNGACTAIALLAFLYEGFKVLRQVVAARQLAVIKQAKESKDYGIVAMMVKSPSRNLNIALHLLQTLMHVMQIFFGYLLMLAFMTYNTGICVSTILGFGLGYLAFGWYNPSSNMKTADGECCNT